MSSAARELNTNKTKHDALMILTRKLESFMGRETHFPVCAPSFVMFDERCVDFFPVTKLLDEVSHAKCDICHEARQGLHISQFMTFPVLDPYIN